jgi:hypothetical protein
LQGINRGKPRTFQSLAWLRGRYWRA